MHTGVLYMYIPPTGGIYSLNAMHHWQKEITYKNHTFNTSTLLFFLANCNTHIKKYYGVTIPIFQVCWGELKPGIKSHALHLAEQ